MTLNRHTWLALLGLRFLICKVQIITGPASYQLLGGLNKLIHGKSLKCGSERVKYGPEDTQQILQLAADSLDLSASPQNPGGGVCVLRLREGIHPSYLRSHSPVNGGRTSPSSQPPPFIGHLCVQGTVLGDGGTVVNKTNKNPCPGGDEKGKWQWGQKSR